MSALAIPVHVIKMLDASILKVLSAVLVNRDTLEVAQYVKAHASKGSPEMEKRAKVNLLSAED